MQTAAHQGGALPAANSPRRSRLPSVPSKVAAPTGVVGDRHTLAARDLPHLGGDVLIAIEDDVVGPGSWRAPPPCGPGRRDHLGAQMLGPLDRDRAHPPAAAWTRIVSPAFTG